MNEQTTPDPSWVPLARATLTAAARQDYAEATRLGQQLADECGPREIPRVMCAWLDTVIAQEGVEAGQFDAIAWADESTGRVRGADDVPPASRWAGRLFLARANLDEATFMALLRSVSSDQEWQRNVSAVLMQCGAQLRRIGHRDVTRD